MSIYTTKIFNNSSRNHNRNWFPIYMREIWYRIVLVWIFPSIFCFKMTRNFKMVDKHGHLNLFYGSSWNPIHLDRSYCVFYLKYPSYILFMYWYSMLLRQHHRLEIMTQDFLLKSISHFISIFHQSVVLQYIAKLSPELNGVTRKLLWIIFIRVAKRKIEPLGKKFVNSIKDMLPLYKGK